eukprot:COSAG05_NODE_2319_length_3240_cov_3.126393_1_plen_165_part_10
MSCWLSAVPSLTTTTRPFINDTELIQGVANKDIHGHVIRQADHGDTYLAGIYFAALTVFTVGYGDNCRPWNVDERLISFCIIIGGTFITAWIKGAFSASVQAMARDAAKYDELLRHIHAHLMYHEVPPELGERITLYFEYRYAGKVLFDENALQETPVRIRADYM